MTLSEIIEKKFEIHGNRGHIADTCTGYLSALEKQGPFMKSHVCRVALVSEAVAGRFGLDTKAAFYAGLLHDFGKILLPPDLFNGDDINPDQYREVQTHAEKGFALLKDSHLFSALIAGLHHQMGTGTAYGIACDEIPEELGIETIEEIVELAQIVSAADFTDAARHRKTTFLGPESGTLKQMLLERYDRDEKLVAAILEEADVVHELDFEPEADAAE